MTPYTAYCIFPLPFVEIRKSNNVRFLSATFRNLFLRNVSIQNLATWTDKDWGFPAYARTQYVGSILKDVFLIFPQYCLGRGLMDMATEMNINLIVAKFGFISERNRYSWNFLGKYMACMVIQVRLRFLIIVSGSGEL